MLASMLVSGMASQGNIRNLKVNLILPSDIFAGEPFNVVVEVTNIKKRLPAFFIKVELLGQSSFIIFIKAKESKWVTFQTSLPKRGIYRNLSITITSRFPFNFFTRSILVELDQSILVYPAPRVCGDSEALSVDDEGKDPSKGKPSTVLGWIEDEIVSIRDYQDGDAKKSINWKATAKTGSLKVNERMSEEPRVFLIDLERFVERDLEEVLSCATYLTLRYIEMGWSVGLRDREIFIPPGTGSFHLRNILEILALYELRDKAS
ncbi:MAG: DUF58 domain-containing protein [Syntrophobacterales bacterium]|nr:DUF58 domain-containing protein [Syntrophobacterales bacterium]